MGERVWPNSLITFVAKKLNLQFILLYLQNMWERLKMSEYRHMIFKRSLSLVLAMPRDCKIMLFAMAKALSMAD